MTEKKLMMMSLLSGLGRPTLRGIRKCPKCSTVNGTRGSSCKNKDCDVVFRGKGRRKDATTLEAVQVLGLPGYNDVYFSVRCKDRGKDHRNFVQLTNLPGTGFRCLQETCSKNSAASNCAHILAAQNSSTQSEPLQIKESVFSSISIPARHLNTISCSLQTEKLSIQRVSKTAFVIALENLEEEDSSEPGGGTNNKSRLEMVHSIFSKPSKSETNIERIFYCSCTAMKNREENSNSGDPFHMMCLHFYICVCAFASNEKLMSEFEQIIPQNTPQEVASSPLLSQLHFVNNDGKPIELDSNISVEIMRENLSLLEMSISAPDDNSLSNVQTLEGVLSDPIIVANVDDALTFGDGTVLDTLDDDHQVCHIFSNPQGTIHSFSYNPSQSQQQQQQQLSDGTSQHRDNILFETQTPPSPSPSNSVPPLSQQSNDNNNTDKEVITLAGNQLRAKKRKVSKSKDNRIQQQQQEKNTDHQTMSLVATRNYPLIPMVPSKELISTEDQNTRLYKGFEGWLAGVNDRINATMNYQLPTQPLPLVYYIPAVYFDFMKERLTSLANLLGGKKRLPNQTFVFQRIDSAPIGSFTKHIWKITNILHVMSVFECSLVRLKTKQYFLKSSNGNFVEWLPPPATNEDNKCQRQRILPVLHSTVLKCGKNYPSPSKESTPFVIEWVPEILRTSKLGELSIRFEFFKIEPTAELGREISQLTN